MGWTPLKGDNQPELHPTLYQSVWGRGKTADLITPKIKGLLHFVSLFRTKLPNLSKTGPSTPFPKVWPKMLGTTPSSQELLSKSKFSYFEAGSH